MLHPDMTPEERAEERWRLWGIGGRPLARFAHEVRAAADALIAEHAKFKGRERAIEILREGILLADECRELQRIIDAHAKKNPPPPSELDIELARHQREWREQAWNRTDEHFRKYVKSIRAEAEAELKTWGDAFKSGAKARAIVDDDIMLHGDVKTLRKLLDDNKKKQRRTAERVQAAECCGVECDDETVERAIVALTELDADHAAEANREGWAASTSSGGHWCYAMLKVDRALAIKEGRRLIALGKHEEQLRRLGIDVGAAS